MGRIRNLVNCLIGGISLAVLTNCASIDKTPIEELDEVELEEIESQLEDDFQDLVKRHNAMQTIEDYLFKNNPTGDFKKALLCFYDSMSIPYVSDGFDKFGGIDIWKSPRTTRAEGGDCEDKSFELSERLHNNSISNRVVFGIGNAKKYEELYKKCPDFPFKVKVDHAWVECDFKDGCWVFDPAAGFFSKKDLLPDYLFRPIVCNQSIKDRIEKYKKDYSLPWLESNEFYDKEEILAREAELVGLPGSRRAK